jgi:RNA polymerase sigma factor (sigma-70 family)
MTDIAFDRMFWADVIRRVARRTGSHADAEDLVQSAFERMHRYTQTRRIENPAGFLVRTAVNLRLDAYRREKLMGQRHYSANLEDCENNSPAQDQILAARARLERVKSGIAQLPPRTREIFLLHRLEQVKYGELALRFAISESAVEKHVARATAFLMKWARDW